MPSELGTSSFIPNLFCEMFTSGVTSHPLRLTLCTGSAPTSASSAVLYILKCKSRHVNQYRLNAFSVNFFGLYKQEVTQLLQWHRFTVLSTSNYVGSWHLLTSKISSNRTTLAHGPNCWRCSEAENLQVWFEDPTKQHRYRHLHQLSPKAVVVHWPLDLFEPEIQKYEHIYIRGISTKVYWFVWTNEKLRKKH